MRKDCIYGTNKIQLVIEIKSEAKILGERVIVGMSGGVDSSVSAYLMKKQGKDVIGVFMKNWDDKDENGVCTADEDFEDVRSVCATLDIPYYTVNFTKQYFDNVFKYFLDEYKKGRTPNPDILCNKEIKFKAFLNYALSVDAKTLVTGHYAKIEFEDGMYKLKKAKDLSKDQTYFLAALSEDQLSYAYFPLGDILKSDVRKIASELVLKNAKKKDSTGVCFIGERNFKNFLSNYLPAKPGNMVDIKSQKVLGTHDGLMYYTLGQRKGLGIGGIGNGECWFVVEKDLENNILYICQGDDNALYSKALIAHDINFINGEPDKTDFYCNAKFRYRQPDQAVHVIRQNDGYLIEFAEKQRAVTPGQWVVLYDGDWCLGGGPIDEIKK